MQLHQKNLIEGRAAIRKKRDVKGVAQTAVSLYDKEIGILSLNQGPLWQEGMSIIESSGKSRSPRQKANPRVKISTLSLSLRCVTAQGGVPRKLKG